MSRPRAFRAPRAPSTTSWSPSPARGRGRIVISSAAALALAACASVADRRPAAPAPAPRPAPRAQAPVAAPKADTRQVRTTIVRGTPVTPPPPPAPVIRPGGDVTLNFPSVDVQAVAKAVLGDVLGLKYAVDPSIHGVVTIRTPSPIRRVDVLPLFEEALKAADLALADRGGIYTVVPLSTARGSAPLVGPADTGFGNETIVLRFANAEEVKKLLDPVVPGAIAQADPARNVLIVSGTTTQRRSVRELVGQFDVDWLKGMSFALLVPQRTDARLIAPELDKLLNGPGSQSAGLVRLITMERLNGILAISAQPQYLDDVRRWVEVLDREGEAAERRLFVYHVQNGRAADLAKVLDGAFGLAAPRGDDTSNVPGGSAASSNVENYGGAAPRAFGSSPSQLVVQVGGQAARGSSTSPGTSSSGQTATSGQPGAPGQPDQNSQNNPNGTTITADETNNAIVVFAIPREYTLIEDALLKLDVPPLQVLIDATISEVTLNHNLQYGIQWYFASAQSTGALTQGTTSTPVQNFPGFSFLFQHGTDVTATLNALAKITDVTVLSAPKLMVLNNHTASIEVGDQVPIATSSATSTITSGAPTVNSIEYRDTGVILKVTPRVNTGGLVLLDISQEVSDVSNTSTSTLDSPTIQQRKISTSVAVQDGETLALGGLIKNEVTKLRSTIPILGDIPILGHLFGDTGNILVRTELVVLLTPRVVRTPVDADAITRELRAKMHLAPPPPLPDPRHPYGP